MNNKIVIFKYIVNNDVSKLDELVNWDAEKYRQAMDARA